MRYIFQLFFSSRHAFINMSSKLAFFSFLLVVTGANRSIPTRLVSNPFPQKPLIILDSDIGKDADDAGAQAILLELVNRGEAKILAMMYPMKDEWGAPTLDVINTFYGQPAIPIGTYKGNYTYHGSHDDYYRSYLVNHFPNDLRTGRNAPDAIQLYRQVLTQQPDHSVTIVVVGPLRLAQDLINSPPDHISRKTGYELVKTKVRELVIMGGAFPSALTAEWNVRLCPEAARYIATKWPTPIMYSGFEVGLPIRTGERLMSEADSLNPVRQAYAINPQSDSLKNRPSWDQTCVLYAVRGLGMSWRANTVGSNYVYPSGLNEWRMFPDKQQGYLVNRVPASALKKTIEDLMIHH